MKIRLFKLLLKTPLFIAAVSLIGCSISTLEKDDESQIIILKPDVTYTKRKDLDLLADIYYQKNERLPVIILLHGGSWARGSKERLSDVAVYLAERNFAIVNINYRFAPEYPYPAQVEDAAAVVQFIKKHEKKYNFDSSKIGILGYSAGGHIALMLAAVNSESSAPPVQAVVAVGAPTDLVVIKHAPAVYRLVDADTKQTDVPFKNASPYYVVKEKLESIHRSIAMPSILLLHGKYDWIVDLEHAEKMNSILKQAGVRSELVELEAGHLRTTNGLYEEGARLTAEFFSQELHVSGM